MGAKRGRLAEMVDTFVARQPDALLGGTAQRLRHRVIDPQNPMIATQNGDQVGRAIEDALQQLLFPQDRLAIVAAFGNAIGIGCHASFPRRGGLPNGHPYLPIILHVGIMAYNPY